MPSNVASQPLISQDSTTSARNTAKSSTRYSLLERNKTKGGKQKPVTHKTKQRSIGNKPMLRCFSFYTPTNGTSIAISRKAPPPAKSTAVPVKLIAPLGRPTVKGKGCKRFPTPKERSYDRGYDNIDSRPRVALPSAASKATSGREQHYQRPRIDYFFPALEALPSTASGL